MVWNRAVLEHLDSWMPVGGQGESMEETSVRDQIGAIRTEGRNRRDTNQSRRKTGVLCSDRVQSTEDQNTPGLLITFFMVQFAYSESPFAGSDFCY